MDHQICFFCCKFIKYDLTCKGNDKHNQPDCPSITGTTSCNTTSQIKTKANIKSIRQISQFLKVPRNLVAQLKEYNDFVSLSVCENCEEISKTLSKWCRDVEVIQMKISHYLNLLTDRIIGLNNDDDHQVNKQEIQFTELQKDIHKKCLLKVRELEDRVIPQVILTKCKVPSSKPPQFEPDDFEDDDHLVILEADENQIKIELRADDNPELQSCPFCNFTATCGDQLQDHISNQHSEQFEYHSTIHSNSDSTVNEIDLPKLAAPLLNTNQKELKTCEICGAMMMSRNLGRHTRIRHKINISSNEHKTLIKCDFCPQTFKSEWHKGVHTKAVHLRPSPKLTWNNRVKKCEICGVMVTAHNLTKHKRNRHTSIKKSAPINSNNLEISAAICQEDLVKGSVHLKNKRKKPTKKKCEICGTIIGSGSLSKPMRVQHADIAHKYICFRNEQRNIVSCDFCPLTFTSVWNKEGHTKAVHLRPASQLVGINKVKKCEICGAMISVRSLAAHKRIRHESNGMGIEIRERQEQNMKFKCVVCGNGYSSREDLLRHYQKSKKCGMGKKDEEIEMEMSLTDTMIKDDNLFEHAEDPLQI